MPDFAVGRAMSYHLLTGATGLLGRYLVWRLTTAGVPLAVLVRAGRFQSASDRMEAIMHHWETVERRALARPVVLEGELTQPGLGLSAADQKWIAGNCDTVVHSAAAMVFQADEDGEPHRTNVEGMGNLLEMCRRTEIRRFHHVSTAYICGLRQGRVLEDELDVGQALGNVYEQSKIAAEKMLRSAEGLDQITVYRPASVIGDSQTGYTSNFHGFYLPLLLAYSFCNAVPPEEMNNRFMKPLGLSGTEGKNFVPVDWVTACIAHVVTHAELHGRTYHLASPKPVSVQTLQTLVQEAIRRYCKRPIAAAINAQELAVYEKLFHDQLLIYRSHWRDDPKFDLTNTSRALGHLPCPDMNLDLLLRVARWPVENGFTVPNAAAPSPQVDCRQMLATWLGVPDQDFAAADTIDLNVTGCGGGQWRLAAQGEHIVGARRGRSATGSQGYYLNSNTLAALVRRGQTVEQAIRAGRLVIEGPRERHQRLIGILKRFVAASPAA
jgi:thioester reductase-like protein